MICGIVLAAGRGSRFGEQKQFIQINGKALWKHIYDKLCVVISKEDIVAVGIDIPGGTTRSQSVVKGLIELGKRRKSYSRIVIVEAARPFITEEQLQRIIEDTHDSCTYVLPLASTVVTKKGEYLDRENLYKLSTPAAFNYRLFSQAYLSGKYPDCTDDTRIMHEHYGIRPHFLEGAENMIKVTYRSDLAALQSLMKRYKQ